VGHTIGAVRRQLCASAVISGVRFSKQSPPGAQMLAASNINAAAQSPHGTTSDHSIPRSSSAKKLSHIVNFLNSLEFWRSFHILKCLPRKQDQDATEMHGFNAILYISNRKWSQEVT
jgi:hypothetical protein